MAEQSMTERLAAMYWSFAKMVWSWGNYLGACTLAAQAFANWMGWSRIAEWINAGLVRHFVTREDWQRAWEYINAENEGGGN